MDHRSLQRAYDRSAEGYDERFRDLQREKYRAAASSLVQLDSAGIGAGLEGLSAAGGFALDAGAGTALFEEWLADPAGPHAALRASLLRLRWLAIDLSAGMLRQARARSVRPAVADLARLPLRPASCAFAVAFTSILEDKPAALRSLGACLCPGALLVATFLRDEAPAVPQLAKWSGLTPLRGPLPAGQDDLFLLRAAR